MRNKTYENVILRFHYLLILAAVVFGYFKSDNKHFVTVFLVVSVVYAVFFEIYSFLKRRNSRKLARNIVNMLDMTSQKRIDAFPISIIVTDSEGEILWYNERLIDAFGEEEIINLRNIKELNHEILSNSVTKISWNGKFFTVFNDNFIINISYSCTWLIFDGFRAICDVWDVSVHTY